MAYGTYVPQVEHPNRVLIESSIRTGFNVFQQWQNMFIPDRLMPHVFAVTRITHTDQ